MATPSVFSYTLEDNDGVKASAPFYASYNGAIETVDALIGTWLDLGGGIDLVSGAKVISGSITIPLARDPSWKATPLVGQSVSDVLSLSFGNDDTIYRDTFVVPAVRDALIVDGKPIISAGAILDMANLLVGGFTNGSFVNAAGSDLNLLIAAFQAVRKHRTQLKARSTARP